MGCAGTGCNVVVYTNLERFSHGLRSYVGGKPSYGICIGFLL